MRVLSKISKILAVTGLCAAIAGCAIRPLPGDYGFVSRVSKDDKDKNEITPTIEIIERIRCEARAAIAETTMAFIDEDLDEFEKEAIAENNPEKLRFLATLKDADGKYRFNNLMKYFDRNGLKKSKVIQEGGSGSLSLFAELNIVSSFRESSVGYEFELTTKENNSLSDGMLGFQFARSGGMSDLGLTGAYTRERQNKRVFDIAEKIQDLVFPFKDGNKGEEKRIEQCDEHNFSETENWNYPIYGKVNLLESFKTFANLVLKFRLGNNDVEVDKKQKLSDQILFTTTTTGSVNPSVTITPITTGARINNAAIKLGNTRTDTHQLTLVLIEDGVNAALDALLVERVIANGIAPIQ